MSSIHPSYEIRKIGSAREERTPFGGLTKREYYALEFAKSLISSGANCFVAVETAFEVSDAFIRQS